LKCPSEWILLHHVKKSHLVADHSGVISTAEDMDASSRGRHRVVVFLVVIIAAASLQKLLGVKFNVPVRRHGSQRRLRRAAVRMEHRGLLLRPRPPLRQRHHAHPLPLLLAPNLNQFPNNHSQGINPEQRQIMQAKSKSNQMHRPNKDALRRCASLQRSL
jgi:hypothetical protein